MQRMLGDGAIVDETYPCMLRNQRFKQVIGVCFVWRGRILQLSALGCHRVGLVTMGGKSHFCGGGGGGPDEWGLQAL